jgi:cobalt-zinc-cadmium resistance protein CzcA
MTLQGGSLSNTIEKVEMANKILLENFPEVKHAVCKIGASEIPTDPTPMETGDYIITLKDKSEWTSAETREELVGKMEEKLAVLAGVKFEFQQPIQMRFNELLSGSKQDIAIKIYGDELSVLADKALEIDELIHHIEGVEDVDVEKVTGLAQVQVSYNRDRLAQYGLSVSDVNRVLRTAFAGSQAGVVYDNDKRYGLVVRLDKDYRQSIEDVRNLSVELPNGSQVPFDALATIEVKSGPAQVSRENTQRRISIGFNVRNRDVQSVIKEVRHLIDQKIKLPSGYHISYGGQFQNLEAAKNRLAIAVPVALILIFVLLFFTFHSVKQSLLIFTAVPMSAIGGVIALWIRDMNFSISAGVGFIALFGVAVLNGIVLIAEFNRLKKDGVTDIGERVRQGLKVRLRPVLMTAAVASLGFLPMALSTSAGAEVQKPLATVVIGGLLSATLLTLIVLPIFYVLAETHSFKSLLKRQSVGVMLLIVTMLTAGNVASAQQARVFSLNDAIKTALDSNLQVKSSRLQVDEQRALKGAAIDIPKTVIDGEYGQINSYTKDNSFTVSQSFAFPTVYVNQAKLANANIKSSELQMQLSQLNMATQVKQTYWYLSYLHSLLYLVENQDSTYAVFQRAAELRAKSGETNQLEMISARSMSMEVRNRLQQVRADIDICTQKLEHLLNFQGDLAIADTMLSRLPFAVLDDSMALTESPVLGYDKHQIEVSRFEKKLERSRMMPELSVGYSSQTMQGVQEVNGAPRTFGSGDRFNGIQAGISMPLWFVPYTSKSKAAAIKEQAARTNAEYSQQTQMANYRTLLSEYAKYCRSVDYYEKQAVPEADMIIRQATLSFKAGVLDYTEFALNLSRAMQIKQSYLEALNGYNQTVIQLEFVMGKIY